MLAGLKYESGSRPTKGELALVLWSQIPIVRLKSSLRVRASQWLCQLFELVLLMRLLRNLSPCGGL